MLYTRKGDSGTTKTFGCDQRISKSSAVAEALGSLDEINSYLGLLKVKSSFLVRVIIGTPFAISRNKQILASNFSITIKSAYCTNLKSRTQVSVY